jgi:hypothetical protein
MYTLFLLLWVLIVFIAMPVLFVMLIVNLIRKKQKWKILVSFAVCFNVSVVCVFGAMFTVPEDMQKEMPTTTIETTTEKPMVTTTETATAPHTTEKQTDPPTTTKKATPPTKSPTTEQHSHKYVEVDRTQNFDLKETVVKKACSCGKTKTETIDMSTNDMSKYLKSKCKTYAYEEIARNPDTYKDKLAVFTGEVIQVQEVLGTTTLLVNITKEGDEYYTYYTDTVYVNYEFTDELKLLEGDIITMYGKLQGERSYLTVLGQYVSAPFIEVYYAELK